jgi:hypothetical protein
MVSLTSQTNRQLAASIRAATERIARISHENDQMIRRSQEAILESREMMAKLDYYLASLHTSPGAYR